MLKRKIIVIMALGLFFILSSQNVRAQEEDTTLIIEPSAGSFFGLNAKAMGMGGAYIALANDASALIYNPAGLSRMKRIELGLGMSHQRFKNESGNLGDIRFSEFNDVSRLQSNTRFGSINLALPVPTYRGSLVFALGVNRVNSFDRTFEFSWSYSPIEDHQRYDEEEEGLELESGGLYVWSVGGGVDISPNLSLGASLNYWTGKENWSWNYRYSLLGSHYDPNIPIEVRYKDTIEGDYSGFSAKLGFLVQPNNVLTIGGTLESPIYFTIDEEWRQYTEEEYPDEIIIYEETGFPEYELTLPYNFGLGAALNLNRLTLAADMNYTDWTQMEYREAVDEGTKNWLIKENYIDVIRWHVGAEFLIPEASTWLRAGYYRNPFPTNSVRIKTDRSFVTAGIGFLIDRVMTLDFAWNYGFWEISPWQSTERQDPAEKYTTHRIFVNFAYRM